jgi:hypothetical protein
MYASVITKPIMGEQSVGGSRGLRCVIPNVIVAVMLAACSKGAIWSTKLVSPNGQWIAGARTDTWDGIGVGAAASAVCIARASEPNNCTDIVVYPPNAMYPTPQITWLSSDDLVVRVPDPSKVVLQTIKFADIRIKLEALPSKDSAGDPVHSTKE